MTSLRDLNWEEWASKPFLIELRGGRADGKQFSWHELPSYWRQPEPAVVDLNVAPSSSLYPDATSMAPIALYRQTGSVTDDGAHVYEFEYFE